MKRIWAAILRWYEDNRSETLEEAKQRIGADMDEYLAEQRRKKSARYYRMWGKD